MRSSLLYSSVRVSQKGRDAINNGVMALAFVADELFAFLCELRPGITYRAGKHAEDAVRKLRRGLWLWVLIHRYA